MSGVIDELVRIARWYQRTGSPSEAETTAYLVVPLLRALRWTPQKMAIGWSGVDLALFSALPRRDENLAAGVEVKQKDRSCLAARSRAQSCAEQPGRGSCTRLIVTDGLRYVVYFRKDGTFGDKPDAYLNLNRMRDAYPVLGCRGAKDAFLYMGTDWPQLAKKSFPREDLVALVGWLPLKDEYYEMTHSEVQACWDAINWKHPLEENISIPTKPKD